MIWELGTWRMLMVPDWKFDQDPTWFDWWRIIWGLGGYWWFLTWVLKDGVILDIIYHVVRWYERYPESLLKILHEQAAKKLFPGWGLVLVMFKEWSKPFNDIFTWHICMSSCVMTDKDITKDIPSSLFLFPNFSLSSYTWERCLHANEKKRFALYLRPDYDITLT
jgi:hypothetical protein